MEGDDSESMFLWNPGQVFQTYLKKERGEQGCIFEIIGLDKSLTVYNLSAPIWIDHEFRPVNHPGRLLLSGRIEPLDNEFNSFSGFFLVRDNGKLEFIDELPIFQLQDPDLSVIENNGEYEVVFGGVKIFPKLKIGKHEDITGYQTEMYRAKSLKDIEKGHFFSGKGHEKDMRIRQIDNDIYITRRPESYSLDEDGNITWIKNVGLSGPFHSLEEITTENLANNTILLNMFHESSWGGIDGLYKLENKDLGIFGHVGWESKDEGGRKKNYIFYTSSFNPLTHKITVPEIVGSSYDIPQVEPKPVDIENPGLLRNVVFGRSGYVSGNKIEVYGGAGDRHPLRMIINHLFPAPVVGQPNFGYLTG